MVWVAVRIIAVAYCCALVVLGFSVARDAARIPDATTWVPVRQVPPSVELHRKRYLGAIFSRLEGVMPTAMSSPAVPYSVVWTQTTTQRVGRATTFIAALPATPPCPSKIY